jgi:hypothetical protein
MHAALVADAAQVPGLVGEHGDPAPGLAAQLVALEGQAIEGKAAFRCQVRESTADESSTVGVLAGPTWPPAKRWSASSPRYRRRRP